MALRKRSHKWGSDKWLSVAFHNARVDMHRNRQEAAKRDKRLSLVQSKLRGEGIDDSWASTALSIMDSNGYGLNQFSTRVLPMLRAEMRDVAELERRRALDQAARSAELERARQARVQVKRDKQESSARLRTERNDASALVRQGITTRRELLLAAKKPFSPPTGPSGPVDPLSIASDAGADVLSAIDTDLGRIEAVLRTPGASKAKLMGEIGRSPYFKPPRKGVAPSLLIACVDLVAYLVITTFLLAAFDTNDTVRKIVLFAMALSPLWVIWRFLRRRRLRVRASVPTIRAAFVAAFRRISQASDLKPPQFGVAELPDELKARIAAAHKAAETYPKAPGA